MCLSLIVRTLTFQSCRESWSFSQGTVSLQIWSVKLCKVWSHYRMALCYAPSTRNGSLLLFPTPYFMEWHFRLPTVDSNWLFQFPGVLKFSFLCKSGRHNSFIILHMSRWIIVMDGWDTSQKFKGMFFISFCTVDECWTVQI